MVSLRNEPPARVSLGFRRLHRELSEPWVTPRTLCVEYREGSAAQVQAPLDPYEYSRSR
ncbi:hypothetical protein WMF27_41620 [Sorangium sp. So ce281]|uniref:hypothetical protein n=1 Tax=unclassified Sorangium TaxID=2621164 RepID=UPI003F6067C6